MNREIASHMATALPVSEIRKIMTMAGQMKDVIHLEVGDPDFPTAPHIIEAANRAALEGDTHYTAAKGTMPLLLAIAAKFRKENGIKCDPATEVIAGTGATGIAFVACLAAVNPGDEVIVTDPNWPYYDGHVMMAGGQVVRVPLREELGFSLDVEEIRARVTPRTRMIVVNSPNNPTGSVLAEETLLAIGELAAERNLLVLSDEVYEKIIFDGEKHFSLGSVPGLGDRVLTVNSMSKGYAMTGWRLGYACGPKPLIDAMAKIQEFTVACVSSVVQRAAIAALTGPQEPVAQMAAAYERRRDLVWTGLKEIPGMKCAKPKGAFYAFPNITAFGMSSFDFAMTLLKEVGVAVVHGSGLGQYGEGHIRISYSTSDANLVEALSRMKAFAEARQGGRAL